MKIAKKSRIYSCTGGREQRHRLGDGDRRQCGVERDGGIFADPELSRQARRIAAIRQAAERKGIALFINARTDLFLGQAPDHAQAVDEALDRAKAYAIAGASGFFIPGLQDDALIGRICECVTLPVNVMVMDGVPSNKRLAGLGVARISYGPIPYVETMDALQKAAAGVTSLEEIMRVSSGDTLE